MEEMKNNVWQRTKGLRLNTKLTIVILLLVFVPIVILSTIMFYEIEQSTVAQSESDMYYRQRELEDAFSIRIENIETMQRSFSKNNELLEILEMSTSGEDVSTRDIIDFYEGIGSFLTGTVENNPVLYTVRVYAKNDDVQELMPILYKSSRMDNMSWSRETPVIGWHFSYYDTSFKSLTENSDVPLLGLVSPINDFSYGTVGFVEAAVEMRTMFPGMYDAGGNDEGWSFYASKDGNIYFGTNKPDYASSVTDEISTDSRIWKESLMERIRIDGRELLFFSIPLEKMNGSYIAVQDITGIINEVHRKRNVFFMMLGLVLIAMVFVVSGMVHRMLGRLYSIVLSMRKIRQGDLKVRTAVRGTDEIGELAVQFNRMLDRIEELTEENVQREILAKNAGIRSLQNQINAHFIYNVLESIKMLAEMDEEYQISDSITSLGKLLRYSMRWESGTVALREELEYIENYLALMNLRNDFSVILATNIPDELLMQEIPKMSLQPIVENSVLHGITPIGEDASIYIKAWEEGNDVFIELSDNGTGMSGEELLRLNKRLKGVVETEEPAHKGHGVGIKNVADRIMLEFGKEYGLTVVSEEGKYTKTSMHLPKRKGKTNEIITDRRG